MEMKQTSWARAGLRAVGEERLSHQAVSALGDLRAHRKGTVVTLALLEKETEGGFGAEDCKDLTHFERTNVAAVLTKDVQGQ